MSEQLKEAERLSAADSVVPVTYENIDESSLERLIPAPRNLLLTLAHGRSSALYQLSLLRRPSAAP